MTNVKANEREFMSLVISWLNNFMATGSYPFEMASADPSIKVSEKETNFPDVQIWLNRQAGHGFCGWELKTPATPVDDQELLEKAAKKARAMHADFFVTWNMYNSIIWRTPREFTLVGSEHRYKSYPPLRQITSPEDIKVESKRALLQQRAREILSDLATLHQRGHLHLIDVDATFFVKELRDAVEMLWPYLHESLIERVGKDATFKEGLFDWAVKQGIANFGEGFYEQVSRQIVYRLLGRILFYLTLRRFRDDIAKLDLSGLDPIQASTRLKECFAEARVIDYLAVFEDDLPDQIEFPPQAVEELAELISDLNRFNFSNMPQDVIGQVFEKLIPYEERHALGQYFTRENLVDLIVAFCVRTKNDNVLDPTCGTGTFLMRAYDRLKYLWATRVKHRQLLPQLWGVDIAPFPAELATINLYRQNLDDYDNFPRILMKDFFDVKPGQVFEFPPPKPSEDGGFKIKEELPVFNGAIGNFPYIRQELIERRIRGYKKRLESVIAEDWLESHPEAFEIKARDAKDIANAKEKALPLKDFYDRVSLKLSGQTDIYSYLFFHTARHLKKDGGRLGFVTSNAWLDVKYGYELQKFFLHNFKIIAILESRCEPWFEDSSANTIVTILERCENAEERDRHYAKFVKVKRKLDELLPWDLKMEAIARWRGLEKLVYTIEKAEHLKPKELDANVKAYENDDFRIRTVKQETLREESERTKRTVKWGRYLRAPDVYFEVLEKCRDKMIPLREAAEVSFGIKSGITDFFRLIDEKIQHWGIEKEFVKPLVTSLKEIENPLLDPSHVKFKLFVCHESKDKLRQHGKTGALSYITFGEEQTTTGRGRVGKEGILYPDVPSVRGRSLWYDVGDREPGDVVVNRFVGERFFFPVNRHGLMISDTFFEVKFPRVGTNVESALLNSTLVYLFAELTGRITWTQGVLYVYGPEINELLIPKVETLQSNAIAKIEKAFDKLLNRSIKPIFEEVKMKDRQTLDRLVLEALGLDPNQYLKPIYDGLCGLVQERISLSKMHKTVKQVKRRRDVQKLKEQVIDEILPNGPKRFPEDFIDAKYLKRGTEISVPKGQLRLGSYFMGQQEVLGDVGFHYPARSVEEGKFIIYAKGDDSFIIRIPKDSDRLGIAVREYEEYLRKLKEKLFGMILKRAADHKLAERMVAQIFTEFGLPEVYEAASSD